MIAFTNLYLLEFFVETARLENVQPLLEEYSGEKIRLCLSFQFLQYPAMEVCEEKFVVQNNSTINFKKGKSCLFASKSVNLRNSREFEVRIMLSHVLEDEADTGSCIKKNLIGDAVVEPGREFLKGRPIRGEFFLKASSGETFGFLNAFLCLSSWGNKIETRFQSGGQRGDQFMFKGTEIEPAIKDGEDIHEENIMDVNMEDGDGFMNGEKTTNDRLLDDDTFTGTDKSSEKDYGSCESFETSEDGDDEEEEEDELEQMDSEDYKEIDVNINNHSLKIKVKRNKEERVISDCGDAINEVNENSESITEKVPSKTFEPEVNEDPGVVKIKGDHIQLDMLKEAQSTQPGSGATSPTPSPLYRFKAGTHLDGNVISISQSADPEMEFGNADRSQETFLMKIRSNRHSDKSEKTGKLDLELRTRKREEPKPVSDEKNTQYDPNDVPATKGKNSKNGGKKDKKKKK